MENKEHVQKLKQLAEDIKIAMMATEDDGHIRSRPMAVVNVEDNGTLWFFTNDASHKMQEIKEHRQVNVSFSDRGKADYVSISGKARIRKDKDLIEKYWTPFLKAWFPEGMDDPNLALLQITPEQAEYWDASNSKMVRLFNYAKAIITGTRYDAADNEKLDF